MSKHRQQGSNALQATARAQEQQANREQLQRDLETLVSPAQQGSEVGAALAAAVATPPAPIAIVPPPAPKMTVTDRGIEYENPTIDLGHHVFAPVTATGAAAAPGVPLMQVNKLRPSRALVIHGAIVIEEMRLTLPLAGNIVRS